MNIVFKHITLHNFQSYADVSIDLENKGFCAVIGKNLCKHDNALSNGAGKSVIFEAIIYALTGSTSRGVTSNLKRIGTDDEMWVELTLLVNNDTYIIRRGEN